MVNMNYHNIYYYTSVFYESSILMRVMHVKNDNFKMLIAYLNIWIIKKILC